MAAHGKRTWGEQVKVDHQFLPPFARYPSEVVREKPSGLNNKMDYLVEWATGERAWIIEWAVHDPNWIPETGLGCRCQQIDVLNSYRIPQL